MTVGELFEFIADVKPHAFSEETLMVWLNELEAMIQREVLLKQEVDLYTATTEDLRIPEPHDSIYRYYLQAMVDFHNGEYDKYNATYEVFNSKLSDYKVWRTTHYPTVGSLEWGQTGSDGS